MSKLVSMDKATLIKEIELAFKDVILKDGIGINEADRMHTNERDVLIQKGRNLDRLWWNAWTEIDDKYISSYSSVMDFMDSQGLQWVLPAYMIYIINHYKEGSFSVDSTIYTLEMGALGTDKLDLYSPEQKTSIAKFLLYIIAVGETWVDIESAQLAIDKIWGEYI